MAQPNKMAIAGLIGAASMAATLLIMPFEGEHLKSYSDPPGIQTLCWGHTKGVRINQYATDHECLVDLGQDARAADADVRRAVKVQLSDKTRAAFISFVFNVGAQRFYNSTMLRKLNSGDIVGACNELPKWVYAGGEKLPGLIRRRESEKALCLAGVQE